MRIPHITKWLQKRPIPWGQNYGSGFPKINEPTQNRFKQKGKEKYLQKVHYSWWKMDRRIQGKTM